MTMPIWLRVVLGVLAAAAVLYIVFVVNELGGVDVPRIEKVTSVKALNHHQNWPDGWEPGQANWFHHASQGTRILPYEWFIHLEQPSLVPLGKIVEGGYLERFGFLPSREHDQFNPKNHLPIGFAIDWDYEAGYANPPWSGPVIGLTCAACHTGQLTYRDPTTRLLKGIRIEGGSAMINLAEFQEAIGRALGMTVQIDSRFNRFADNVLGSKATPGEKQRLRDQLKSFLDVGLASKEYARAHKLKGTVGGFGRTDALGLIGNRVFGVLTNENLAVPDAPVNFPPLWDTAWFDWVQYNASIRMPMVRNIGEALGVGASVNLHDRPGQKPWDSTVKVMNLALMEEQLGGKEEFSGLKSPRWEQTGLPALEDAKVQRGKALYWRYCQDCHLPPIAELKDADEHWVPDPRANKRFLKLKRFHLRHIGTDPNQAMNLHRRFAVFQGRRISASHGLYAVTEFIRRDKYEALKALDPSGFDPARFDRFRTFSGGAAPDHEILHDASGSDEVLVANQQYKARPLNGLWATPPFLHNGSVPNLDQLLSPVKDRDTTFYLGRTLYDPVRVGFDTEEFSGGFLLDTSLPGNSNAGHEFRNLTVRELESLDPRADHDALEPEERNSPRRAAVLGIPFEELQRLQNKDLWEATRRATVRALESVRRRPEHPFPGVIGPELSPDERLYLIEYLKSL